MNMRSRIRRVTIGCTAVATILVAADAALATTYYVRKTGNNSNSGTSSSNAYLTITKAIASAQPGDVVYVGAGTYSEALATVRSGTEPLPMRFIGDRDGSKTGDAGTVLVNGYGGSVLALNAHSYIGFYGFTLSGGMNATVSISSAPNVALIDCVLQSGTIGVNVSSSTVRLVGCTIQSNGGAGVSISGTNPKLLMQRCTIQSAGSAAVVQSSATGSMTLSACRIAAAGQSGVDVTRGAATITNCVVTGCGASGIIARNDASTCVSAWHNTMVACGSAGITLDGGTLTLKNNIVATCGTGLRKTCGTLTHSNNLYWSNGTTYSGTSAGSGDISANPMFAPGGSNYSLQSGSPAINAAANAAAVTNHDFALVSRPQGGGYDMGAYEYAAALTAANVPYSNNFESAMGSEWSVNTRSATSTFTNFAGRHGNNKLTLKLNTSPGITYKVKFDFYGIDSWDGEEIDFVWGPDRLNIDANGARVLTTSFTWEWSYPSLYPNPPTQSGHLGFNSGWTDAIYRNVTTSFTATSAVTTLDFYGEGLQELNDESWGIDNLTITGGVKIVKWRDVPVNNNGS